MARFNCTVSFQIPPKEIEKIEEEKLKSRFNPRPAGHSAFLQKRLAKGVSTNLNQLLEFHLLTCNEVNISTTCRSNS